MLDFKIILVYLFISSIAYRFLLFPKKIKTPRGFQLIVIFIYNLLLVLDIIPMMKITFFISGVLYLIFIFYPQIQAKIILKMIIKSDGKNESLIEKKLENLFVLTFDFKALKYEDGMIEYFLKIISENTKKTESPPINIKTIVKRGSTHTTYVFMIIIVAMFSLTYTSDVVIFQINLIKYGGNFYELVKGGEYFRLFSSIFLHGSLTHLLMNGFALFYLGMFVERITKTRSYYFSIFIVGGVLASLSSFLLANQNSVGASGAIFALIGSLFSITWVSKDSINPDFRRKILRDVLFIVAINIGLGLSIENIDNYAHMGGLISGAAITYLLYKLDSNIIFKLFDVLAVLIVAYGSFFLYNNLENSYPRNISYSKNTAISNLDFKIPKAWTKVKKDNNFLYQDLFLTRFILEGVSK